MINTNFCRQIKFFTYNLFESSGKTSKGIERNQKASKGIEWHQKASEGIERHQKTSKDSERHQKIFYSFLCLVSKQHLILSRNKMNHFLISFE